MIREAILRWARAREPHFIIGGRDRPYLLRWWLIPRNPVLNIYVHQFLRSDDDRALHDHPYLWNVSWLMAGNYMEWIPSSAGSQVPLPMFRKSGDVVRRWGPAPHRIQLHRAGGEEIACWTLFITGPRVREWGFHCARGWIPWQQFTDARDAGAIGKGCE